MRVVIQKVKQASVTVDSNIVSSYVLLGWIIHAYAAYT